EGSGWGHVGASECYRTCVRITAADSPVGQLASWPSMLLSAHDSSRLTRRCLPTRGCHERAHGEDPRVGAMLARTRTRGDRHWRAVPCGRAAARAHRYFVHAVV